MQDRLEFLSGDMHVDVAPGEDTRATANLQRPKRSRWKKTGVLRAHTGGSRDNVRLIIEPRGHGGAFVQLRTTQGPRSAKCYLLGQL